MGISKKYRVSSHPVSYVIVPTEGLTEEQRLALLNVCISSRSNIPGTKAIMKYLCDTPDLLKGYTSYTYNEIKKIIKTEEWTLEVNDD